jgi:hypothetical protein
MSNELHKTTNPRAPGAVRVVGSLTERKHPADGMTAVVQMGDGAAATIINPQCLDEGGPGWHLTWGNVEGVRYTAASLLESYDYLLSGNISMAEAARRLRLLRAARKGLANGR